MHKGFDRYAILDRLYRPVILAWDWEAIKADVAADATQGLADADRVTDAVKYNCRDMEASTYLGSVFSLLPSGKYYMPWTSNQTRADVTKDEVFMGTLEEVAQTHGLYVRNGDGDPCDLYAGSTVTLPDVPLSLCVTMDDVRAFLGSMVALIGGGYHPDTRGQEYVETGTDQPVFDAAVAARVDLVTESAFEVCEESGVDIYSLTPAA